MSLRLQTAEMVSPMSPQIAPHVVVTLHLGRNGRLARLCVTAVEEPDRVTVLKKALLFPKR